MRALRSASAMVLLAALAAAAMAQSKPKPAKTAPAGSSLQATIEKLEKAEWDTWVKQDEKALVAMCAPGYSAALADQKPPRDATATAQMSHQLVVTKYSFSDMKETSLGPDAALATYSVTGTLNLGGKTQDFKLAVTEIWVKRGGQWKSLRYHESEIK